MMSIGSSCKLLVAVALLAWMPVARAADFKLPADSTTLKPGRGVELVTANCLLCHSSDYISTQPRLSATQWRASVLKMQSKYGAPIATNNVDVIAEYLTKNYGAIPSTTNAPPSSK